MKNTTAPLSLRNHLAFGAALALLMLCGQTPAKAQGPKTFDVTQAPYGADKTGVTDDTAAIQKAVDDAIQYGNANGHPRVTVLLPAGTYLVATGAIRILNSTNLTFTGAGVADTMLWFTRANDNVFFAHGNTNFTLQNFSSDVQKLPQTGLYDLGISQGTITAVNTAAKQVTVKVEGGYPLMSRDDFKNAATMNGWSKAFWTLSDPSRLNFDDNAPTITAVAPSADGTAAVLTLQSIGYPLYVGEKWLIFLGIGGTFIDIGYGNAGTTTVRGIHYYGGGMGTMGIAENHTGTLTFNGLYCGPPPYQKDRLLTSNGGWAMSSENRASILIENSTLLQIWDDVFDIGCGEITVLSQPAPNQVVVQDSNNGDYQAGDAVVFTDDTAPPLGTTYGQSKITAVTRANGQVLVTLDRPVTVHNPAKDFFTDLTQAGPITAINDTFQNATSRRVNFRSGVGVTVTGCTFKDNTPLVLGGIDSNEGPSDAHNVTVTGNTFLHDAVCLVWADDGHGQAPTGSNITISGNRFLDGGRGGMYNTPPLTVNNVTGARVSNNYFDNLGSVNLLCQYDAGVNVTGNTFLHPNQIPGLNPAFDTSVISLSSVSGGSLSGNIVYGAGPYTYFLNQAGKNVAGVTGLTDGGTLDIDNPVSFFPTRDKRKRGKWTALPSASAPGSFTLQPYLSVGTRSSPNAAPAQTWTLASLKARNITLITPPTAAATQQFGTVTVSWVPVPATKSYSVGRSTTPGGPYTTLASGLTSGPYTDAAGTAGAPYYYVVTAAGLPAGSDQSNEVCAVPNADYVPVNMAAACNAAIPEPHGRYVLSLGRLFVLGAPGRSNAASDAGQRIPLPPGFYSRLLVFGAGAPRGPFSAGAFHLTITYADGSSATLGRGATLDNATSPHGFALRLDPNKAVAWLTLPDTGQFRILAMDLSGVNRSTLAPGQSLLPGQYLVSPNRQCFLTQQSDGSLALCRGSDPSRKGVVVWSSGRTEPPGDFYTALQSDGNLVTYSGASSHPGKAVWDSATWDKGVTSLQVTDTGQVQLLNGSTVVWEKP